MEAAHGAEMRSHSHLEQRYATTNANVEMSNESNRAEQFCVARHSMHSVAAICHKMLTGRGN